MSPRQARRERRQAERRAKKAESKRLNTARFIPAPVPVSSESAVFRFVSQPSPEPIPAPLGDASRQRRREINRANAQHSTGPRSQTGKLASSRNSLKHGLASGTLIIPGEDRAAFEELQAALLEEHQPATANETLLITEMAQSWWLTQRAIRLQNDCFTKDEVDERRLAVLLRHQTAHERAFHKALNALIRIQKERRREAGFVSQPAEFVRENAPTDGFVSQGTTIRSPNTPPPLAEAA
jgi:hypothetical protein